MPGLSEEARALAGVSEADLDALAQVLAVALASWWRRQTEQDAAVNGAPATNEGEADADAHSSPA
jgi:hypothetical protein